MAAQTPRQAALLDCVDELLRETQDPIHYRDLTKILIESGLWANPWGKEPDQILYSALHNDVKRHGQGDGRFLFMGGGIFCTSFVEGLDELIAELPTPAHNVTPRDQFARTGDMPGDAERRRAYAEAASSDKRCGNCKHLEWQGPNIHTHECGTCSMYTQNGRATVFKRSRPCDLWTRRMASQVNADHVIPVELISEAEHIRITGNRPKDSRWR